MQHKKSLKPQHERVTKDPICIKQKYVPSPPKFTISVAKVRSELTDISAANKDTHIPYEVYAKSTPETSSRAAPEIDIHKLSASVSRAAVVDELSTRKLMRDESGAYKEHAMEPIYAGRDDMALQHIDEDAMHMLEPHILDANIFDEVTEDAAIDTLVDSTQEEEINVDVGATALHSVGVDDKAESYVEHCPSDTQKAAAKMLDDIIIRDTEDTQIDSYAMSIAAEIAKTHHTDESKSTYTRIAHSLYLRNVLKDPHIEIKHDDPVMDEGNESSIFS